MSRICQLVPRGWPCLIEECPPGYFCWMYGDDHRCIGFKTEYGRPEGEGLVTLYRADIYNEAGEMMSLDEGAEVQPLEIEWGDE